MRIAFDAKRLFNNFTGLGNYSRTVVKNLSLQCDCRVHLYTPKLVEREETRDFLDKEEFRIHLPRTNFTSLWRTSSIVKQLEKDGIELYHGLSNEVPLGIQNSRVKSVVTIHDLIFKSHPETYRKTDRAIYDFKFRNACRNADRVLAISESTKADIVKWYNINPDKINVLYQSCSSIFFNDEVTNIESNPLSSLPHDFMLYVGSIIERKNLLGIVEAMGQLPKESLLPLIVVGRGSSVYKKKVVDKIEKLGLAKQVVWVDNLEGNSELKALYKKAKVLIYPSFYEGFGLPVVEALLCKTAVITSQSSSLPEAGGPNSLYVDPHNSEELAAAIDKVLSDTSLQSSMAELGLEYALQKFSPSGTADQLCNIYHSTLGVSNS